MDFIALLFSRGASPDQHFKNLEGHGVVVSGLIRDLRRAGGWQQFVNEPRARLLHLRTLCERGRATPPRRGGAVTRLFETRSRRALPPPVFFHVLSFWRTDRDSKY